jgi:hypothetical protein
MAAFLIGGLIFLFIGQKDLFAAVAVSGTASMFLTPVIFFNILGNCQTRPWAYSLTFLIALFGAALYMLEAGGQVSIMTPLLGIEHKYAKLLVICMSILVIGNVSFAIGSMKKSGIQKACS